MLAKKLLLSAAAFALGCLLVEALLRATRLDLLALRDPLHLSRAIELARAHGARALLLDAPAAPLTPQLRSMKRILAETGYDRFESLLDAHARYQEITARVAREESVPFVRTEPEPDAHATYFSGFDLMHPDAGGHARIAELLHEAILAAAPPPGAE
jgi:lysophospholipase L1-like esterase